MKVLMWGFITVILVLVLVIAWAGSQSGSTELIGQGELIVLEGTESAVPADPVGKLGVMAWNIGYGRGSEGDYAGPWSMEVFEKNLGGIADVIRDSGVDIVLLQEVDLGAARSHGVHQGRDLAERLGWKYCACVTTWSNRYVPFPYWPPERHYGAMRSGQCVLSRYPIDSNIRHRQPQPRSNPFWYNMFYLHRAVQAVEIRVPGLGVLPLMNVHLEAFDVENNRVHVNRLLKLMEAVPSASLIVGGDFNALPVGVEKRKGYKDEPDIDFTGGDSMEIFFEGGRMQDAISATDFPEAHTFPADAPTRRLDYLAGDSRGWKLEGRVVRGITGTLSDHLPVQATLTPVSIPDEGALPPGEGQP